MNILFLASEVVPFSKTGGLADVGAALPAALARRGHEVRVVTPLYGQIRDARIKPLDRPLRLRFPYGTEVGALHRAQVGPRHEVLFLAHPGLYERGGLYNDGGADYPDNHLRFGFLSVGALTAAQLLGFAPDIVHLNDWQTGPAAVALKRGYRGTALARARVVFTIHNLAYQGVFPKSAMDALGIPWDLFTPDLLEFYDQVNFLKAGLAFSDALTTVSPTYAQEIQTPGGGNGLDGFLRARAASLTGVLNGVDYTEWDPKHDPHLPKPFSAKDLAGKRECKRALLARFGLPTDAAALEAPLFGIVSRLADQKGVDLVLETLPKLLNQRLSLVVLGSGELRYEQAFRGLSHLHPTKVGVHIGFDNARAHLVEAGSDFFLMPSRFEPCGLNQMYSLRYATLPIVRATGGLQDTVVDVAEPDGDGLKFGPFTPLAFTTAMRRALELYADPAAMARARQVAMRQDFSWDVAAERYESLYQRLVASSAAA